MKDQESIPGEFPHDLLCDVIDIFDGFTDERREGRIYGTEKEGRDETDRLKGPSDDEPPERREIDEDVGELRQGGGESGRISIFE